MKGESVMQDAHFNGLLGCDPDESPVKFSLICLIADKKYDEALELIDDWLSVEDNNQQTTEGLNLIFILILALVGYEEIAFNLLKSIKKNFKNRKAKELCKKISAYLA